MVTRARSTRRSGSGWRVTVIDIQLGLRLRAKGAGRRGGVQAAGRRTFAEWRGAAGGGGATWTRDGQRGAWRLTKHNLGKGVDAGRALKSTAVLAPATKKEGEKKETHKPKS